MSIAQKEAHSQLVNSGKAKTQQEVILNLLKGLLYMNREQIAKWTGFKESSVTGRCSELVDDGKLIELPIAGVTYYSYVSVDELKKSLKERRKKERTKRVLNALIKDDEAIDFLIKKCFIAAYCSFIRGREDSEIKEDIIEIIKKEIK